MIFSKIRKDFINRTARIPYGEKAVKFYNEPKAHYKSFKIILEKLNLKQEDRYFEIGCGGGVLLGMALKKVKSAAAIDHSQDMVKLSIKNNREYVDSGRAEIVQGDAGKLPWADSSFNVGASANMFFFVEHPEDVLNEICRVLKPGGRFAMVTMGSSLIGKILFGWLYSLRTYSNKKMKSMLLTAGFSIVEVETRWGVIQVCYALKQE